MECIKCGPTKTLTLSVIELSVRKPRDITGERVRHVRDGAFPRDICCDIHYSLIKIALFLIIHAPLVLTIKLMMIIKLLLDVSTLSSVIFKSCKVTVTWQFE